MLKYKINRRTANGEIKNVIVSNIESLEEGFLITTPHIDLLKNENNVSIIRNDGQLSFNDTLSISDIDFVTKTFKINKFSTINYGIHSINNIDGNKLYISLSNEHFFIRNEGFKIKRKVTSFNLNMADLELGDYVIVDNYYLHQVSGDLNNPTLIPTYLTTTNININYNAVDYMLNVIIPITSDGFDDKYSIIVELTDGGGDLLPIEVINFIENSYNSIILFSDDTRFIENNVLTNGTTISLNKNYFDIKINTLQGSKSNLFQTENVNIDFIQKGINDNINPIVDMEKYVFKPHTFDVGENMLTPLSTIEFNFHFRDRDGSTNWQTNDNKYWNGFVLNNTGEITPKTFDDGSIIKIYGDNQSDLLGYLNFTDEDIKFQKSKVKKSFIRILFYDSIDINTQQLLYYSTVFLNTNQLFGKMSGNHLNGGLVYQNIDTGVVSNDISVENEYMVGDNVDEQKRLSTRITVTDKYNIDNSSEGFYLYLFPETFKKPYEEDIYMKVEFNHAGYGVTIPFILPTSESGLPIPFIIDGSDSKKINPQFPTSFIEIGSDGAMLVDMQKYFNSLYVKLKLKCDYENNVFAYYVDGLTPDENDKTKITLNFVEPKIQ